MNSLLLDTHVLVWWVNGEKTLPPNVPKRIAAHAKTKSLAISAMSFWEIAMLVKKGRLVLDRDVRAWMDKIMALPFLTVITPDADILIESVQLDGLPPDPADRIIVATAIKSGSLLLTKDEKIRRSGVVKTCWA